jgi:hypothetical protein
MKLLVYFYVKDIKQQQQIFIINLKKLEVMSSKDFLKQLRSRMTEEQKKFADSLNLTAVSREELEANRTDVHRFQNPEDYMTEESLKYFRDEDNKKAFVEKFWKNR